MSQTLTRDAGTGTGTITPDPTTAIRGQRDFPLYDGTPVRLSGKRWAALMASVAAGGACDLFLEIPGPDWVSTAVRGALFAGIPLVALSRLAPGTIGRLFQRIRPRIALFAVAIAVVNVIVSGLMGSIVSHLISTTSNPMGSTLSHAGPGEKVLTFLSMAPQLIGEEVFTVIILLAVLTLGASVLRLSRRKSLVLAVTASSIVFALLHLSTYDWNLVQCLAVIGVARVVLLIPYLVTKNLTASATAHVLNDWTLFAIGASIS